MLNEYTERQLNKRHLIELVKRNTCPQCGGKIAMTGSGNGGDSYECSNCGVETDVN